MPYRQGNFSYVIDSSFNPFSFNEMLAPFQMYKQEYEKQEERVNDRIKAAGKFAYLADITDNDDPAKKIYQGYVNDLMAQANDLSANGLTMGNRRSITDIWRRYDTEIGALERADERMRKDMDVRSQLRAKGVHMLYANENPKLSDYLYENSPNQFGISTDDLYKSGANLGKSLSSREYAPGKDAGSTLGGFYRVWEEARGVSPENLGEFMNRPSTQALIRNALIAQGANNLTGRNLEEAQSAFMQGMYDNIMYEKSYKPYEDKGKMTPYQEAQLAQSTRSTNLQAALYGLRDRTGRGDWENAPDLENLKTKYGSSGSGSASSSSSSGRSGAGANKITQSHSGLRVKWRGNNPNATNGDADEDYEIENIASDDKEHKGKLVNYSTLPTYAKKLADEIIGDADNADLYQYYFQPYEGSFLGDTEAVLEVIPRDIKDFRHSETSSIFDLH